MIFISSPYTHPDENIREQRYRDVKRFASVMITQGAVAFSPIMYLHHMATEYQMPMDANFWAAFNIDVLRHCEQMIVLELHGWQESKGVQMEISLAEHLGIVVNRARPF